jgi:hypothetical protein
LEDQNSEKRGPDESVRHCFQLPVTAFSFHLKLTGFLAENVCHQKMIGRFEDFEGPDIFGFFIGNLRQGMLE